VEPQVCPPNCTISDPRHIRSEEHLRNNSMNFEEKRAIPKVPIQRSKETS
jgi:hypothetical protein